MGVIKLKKIVILMKIKLSIYYSIILYETISFSYGVFIFLKCLRMQNAWKYDTKIIQRTNEDDVVAICRT